MPASETDNSCRRILIGICGGVAAYKMGEVVSTLAQSGHQVTVAMTRNAKRFIGATTFRSLSGREVFMNPWKHSESPESPHIALARESDLMLISPCTMDMLSKLVSGRADDAVSLLAASIDRASCPVLLAPSMNATMLQQPATQRNMATLEEDGFTLLAPGHGWQACRTDGAGRMPEPADLIASIESSLH
ncbi:MAG: hypothetical protein MK089_03265 [Phycisphaerales bacterium]|nr:hypothetical protein [Phycisphaerales bacterium]